MTQNNRRRNNGSGQTAPAQKGLQVTCKVYEVQSQGTLVAFVTFTFVVDGVPSFVVKDAKLIEGSNGIFLAMPSKKVGDEYQDTAFPITKEFRTLLQESALEAYNAQG